jgi:hypothetical protein
MITNLVFDKVKLQDEYKMHYMPIMILFAASGWNEWRAGRTSFRNKKGTAVIGIIFLIYSIFIAEYLTLFIRIR